MNQNFALKLYQVEGVTKNIYAHRLHEVSHQGIHDCCQSSKSAYLTMEYALSKLEDSSNEQNRNKKLE